MAPAAWLCRKQGKEGLEIMEMGSEMQHEVLDLRCLHGFHSPSGFNVRHQKVDSPGDVLFRVCHRTNGLIADGGKSIKL
jgi:hypothetical protein